MFYSPARTGWGTPLVRTGWGNSPLARTGWGTPSPARTGWGTPLAKIGWVPPPWPGLDGVPPTRDWMGTPPSTRQSSTASTCYAAGGMPLAFTQEDFLVDIIMITYYNKRMTKINILIPKQCPCHSKF